MFPRNPSARRGGFTLAEVIVVAVILAIGAGVVIPYAVSMGDLTVVSAARMIACDLQYAQSTAVTTQDPITVTFNPATDGYLLTSVVASQSVPLNHPINKSDYLVLFPQVRGFEELDISGASFGGGPAVTFDEMGSPDNSGAISLAAGSHMATVTVSPGTGNVTVSE